MIALIRDDQSSVDEFMDERKKLRVPYQCENCSDIQEYDPEIAGDTIPCHSCNGPGTLAATVLTETVDGGGGTDARYRL